MNYLIDQPDAEVTACGTLIFAHGAGARSTTDQGDRHEGESHATEATHPTRLPGPATVHAGNAAAGPAQRL